MTAIVLPDIDRSTIDELKKRIPDLSEIEFNLPSRKDVDRATKEVNRAAKDVGRTADETIDRLLGRKRAPVWPWLAAGIGVVAIAGLIAAWFAWFRRPAWQVQSEPWSAEVDDAVQTTITMPTDSSLDTAPAGHRGSAGAISSEATIESTGSAPYPIEEA
jgi:hypothetical protein